MLQYQNIKIFLQKVMFQNVKNSVSWTYAISDLNKKGIVAFFYRKEFQKTNQKEFRVGKVEKKRW